MEETTRGEERECAYGRVFWLWLVGPHCQVCYVSCQSFKCRVCSKHEHWETVCFSKQKSSRVAKLQVPGLESSGANLNCIQPTLQTVSKPLYSNAQFIDTIMGHVY